MVVDCFKLQLEQFPVQWFTVVNSIFPIIQIFTERGYNDKCQFELK